MAEHGDFRVKRNKWECLIVGGQKRRGDIEQFGACGDINCGMGVNGVHVGVELIPMLLHTAFGL